MDDLQTSEESAFVVEDVQNIIKESIEAVLEGCTYQSIKVPQWTNNVVEQCMKRLIALNKPFKYVVTCLIMQKNGAGLVTASSCYWDTLSDGTSIYRWENPKKNMDCITTVFGLAI
jgi:dynein light chain Tctex-type 1